MEQLNKSNSLYDSIKSLIEESKAQIVRNVNTTIILTYYEIGRMIVEYEQSGKSRAEYADQTLKQLGIDLTRDFEKVFLIETLNILENSISTIVIELRKHRLRNLRQQVE